MAGRINNSPALERLLKKISKRNSKGETPLHTAAIRGSPRLVRQLLMMGADPNAQDHAEWSPLHEVRIEMRSLSNYASGFKSFCFYRKPHRILGDNKDPNYPVVSRMS